MVRSLLAFALVAACAAAAAEVATVDETLHAQCIEATALEAKAMKDVEAATARSSAAASAREVLRARYYAALLASLDVSRVTPAKAKQAGIAKDQADGYNALMVRAESMQPDAKRGVERSDYRSLVEDVLIFRAVHKATKGVALLTWEEWCKK